MAKVLIVDDSMLMRRTLAGYFKKAGNFEIIEAEDGQECLYKYRSSMPDLVTLDINMPKMNGIEAIKKILEIDSEAKILMISSVNQTKVVFEAIQNGAKFYIVKPVTYEKVVESIEKMGLRGDVGEVLSEVDYIEDTESDNNQPVTMESISGGYMFKFSKNIDTEMIEGIENFLNAVQPIKGMNISLNLKNIAASSNESAERLKNLLFMIKQNGAVLRIVK